MGCTRSRNVELGKKAPVGIKSGFPKDWCVQSSPHVQLMGILFDQNPHRGHRVFAMLGQC